MARAVYQALVVSPARKHIPGIQVSGPMLISEHSHLPLEEVKDAFNELQEAEIVDYHADSRTMFLLHEPMERGLECRNPSILLRWWIDWREMPESAEKFDFIAKLAACLSLWRATDNMKCVWWGTFGSTYAHWYWRTTGQWPTEFWATKPSAWPEYCRKKGMQYELEAGVALRDKIAAVAHRTGRRYQGGPPGCDPSRMEALRAATEAFRPSLPPETATQQAAAAAGAVDRDLPVSLISLDTHPSKGVCLSDQPDRSCQDPSGLSKSQKLGRERRSQRSDSDLVREPTQQHGVNNDDRRRAASASGSVLGRDGSHPVTAQRRYTRLPWNRAADDQGLRTSTTSLHRTPTETDREYDWIDQFACAG